MIFTIPFGDFAAGSGSANTFITCALAITADTTGHRCRLLEFGVGPAAAAPVDLNISVRISRILNYSGGGTGTAGSNPTPMAKDPAALATVVTAGIKYTAEPTAYESNPLWQLDVNLRTAFLEKDLPEEGFIIIPNQAIGLLVAPRSANVPDISGFLKLEQW